MFYIKKERENSINVITDLKYYNYFYDIKLNKNIQLILYSIKTKT